MRMNTLQQSSCGMDQITLRNMHMPNSINLKLASHYDMNLAYDLSSMYIHIKVVLSLTLSLWQEL